MSDEHAAISTPQGAITLQAELTLSQQIRNVRLETANAWSKRPMSQQLLTQELSLSRQIAAERAKLTRDYYRSSGGQSSLREELRLSREIADARSIAEKGKLGHLADRTAGIRSQAIGSFFSTTAKASPVLSERFTQALNDLSAVIGRTLLPWLNKLSDGVRSVADWVINLSPEGRKLIGTTIALGTGLLVAVPLVARLATAASLASSALTSLGAVAGARSGMIGSFIGAGVGGLVGHAVGGDGGALVGAAAGGLAPQLLGGMSKGAMLRGGLIGLAAYGVNEVTGGGIEKVVGSAFSGLSAIVRNTFGHLVYDGDTIRKDNRAAWLNEKQKYGSIGADETKELARLKGEDKNKLSSYGASGFKAEYMGMGDAYRNLQIQALQNGNLSSDEQTARNTSEIVRLMAQSVSMATKRDDSTPVRVDKSDRGAGIR